MYEQKDPTGAPRNSKPGYKKCRRCGDRFESEHGELFCSDECEQEASEARQQQRSIM